MKTELQIRWDGDAPGLEDHRLSLATFGRPLMLLLAAFRRVAAVKLRDATDSSDIPVQGRLPRDAQALDLELIGIDGGSLELNFGYTARLEQAPLFPVADRAMEELMACLEDESKGVPRQQSVRKFLQALPSGVREQRYTLVRDGREVRTVSIGSVELPELVDLPHLAEVEGDIIGLGFEPGKTEVRLKTASKTFVCAASPEQVEEALGLRRSPIRAMLLVGARVKLMWIRPATRREPVLSLSSEIDYLCSRWDRTLEELAK